MSDKEIPDTFCGDEPWRENLHRPWKRDGFVYATDGHCMIWTEADRCDCDVTENPEAPDARSIEGIDWAWSLSDLRPPAPDALPPLRRVECSKCDGSGKVRTCPECDGTGVVEWVTAKHDYEADCQECDGSGQLGGKGETCEDCDGVGSVLDDKQNVVKFGPFRINRHVLDKVHKALPDAVFASELNRVYIHFGSGKWRGIAMNCDKETP